MAPPPPGATAPTIGKAHGAIFTKDSRYMFVAELGLDRVYSYRIDPANAQIIPLDPPYVSLHPRSGPRRLQLSPDDRFLYVNHETDSEVSVLAIQAGKLTEIQRIGTQPAGSTAANMTSEMVMHPSGRFLFVANRGPDDISIFTVDRTTGRLTARGNVPAGGKTPRNLRIDPTGTYLLSGNENAGTITVFRIDRNSGALTQTGKSAQIDTPGGMYFLPAK
jgi:6-phosphogluconolactonase